MGQKHLSQALQLPFLRYVVNIAVNHLPVLCLDFSRKSLSIRAVGLSSMRSKQGTFRGRAQSTSGMGPTGNGQAAFLSATVLLTGRRMEESRLGKGQVLSTLLPQSSLCPLPCQASLSLRETGQCGRTKHVIRSSRMGKLSLRESEAAKRMCTFLPWRLLSLTP